MESQDNKYNFNVTCEQNGEEIPGDFVCEDKCGCVQDKKTGTLKFKKRGIFILQWGGGHYAKPSQFSIE